MRVNVRRKESGGNKGLRDGYWERISPGSPIWKRTRRSTLREEKRRLQVRRRGKDRCFVPELGINRSWQVPRFAEIHFVTKDPLPTNPLAAVKFIIIRNTNVFEFGGTIRNFLDKREIPIGNIFSIEIKFGSKDSKGNQGSEQVLNPLSEVIWGL